MWFKRMSLEDWFDAYQYRTRFDVGERALKFLNLRELGPPRLRGDAGRTGGRP